MITGIYNSTLNKLNRRCHNCAE